MKCGIELHKNAQKELEEAFEWYEERSEGLGKRFIEAINQKLNEISKYPERYSKRTAEFREVSANIFPFVLIYEYLSEEKVVYVSYVFHSKRNPKLKYRRRR